MKKIFTIKRVILVMSLILIYAFAFLFVRTYAKKAMLPAASPAHGELYRPTAADIEGSLQDSAESEAVSESENNAQGEDEDEYIPVEYIVDKARAGVYPMLEAAATSVSDDIEVTTPAKTEATTAPPVTEVPETTEKPKTETKAPETEAPKPATEQMPESEEIEETKEESEEVEDGQIIDEQDGEDGESEDVDESEDEQAEFLEEPENDGGLIIEDLTPEQLAELLNRLSGGNSSGGEANGGWTSSNDVLYSTQSYKNQTVTIYDTKQKRMRTENAFDLVCEITNYEIGDTFEKEATKAQAVAIYTYIKYYEQKGEYAEIGTKANPSDFIRECVEEIDGLAMFYDGKYIMAPFSASTGGYSAASKNVWGGDLPYLQSVKNDFDDLDTKNYGKVTTYTVDEVREKIESKTDIRLSDNYSEWIRILSINDNIYAGQLSIDGHTEAKIAGKTRTITGHILRTYVLNIRSTAFTVSYSNGVFTITTYGYGHGVGLSQMGANLYAKYGHYTFDQILHHYFTGITIQ